MADIRSETSASHSRALEWAGWTLGFALGGFFDGILLHQILQWHHLLSGLEEARQDIRVLILADGLFHLLMYGVAAAGLYLLWRARSDFARQGADRRLVANALIGFGAWHIVDAVLSHWILGIHRIRMDADNPLFWDLLWLGLFGIVPFAIGWLKRRGGPRRPPQVASAPLALVLAIAVSGPLAALPPTQDGTALVLFRPDIAPGQAMAAIRSVDGRLLWTDPSQQLWAVELGDGNGANGLYRHGALLVSSSILPLGCLNWFEA